MLLLMRLLLLWLVFTGHQTNTDVGAGRRAGMLLDFHCQIVLLLCNNNGASVCRCMLMMMIIRLLVCSCKEW